jgi:hypothetical protein
MNENEPQDNHFGGHFGADEIDDTQSNDFGASPTGLPVGSVRIGKVDYAVGLLWTPTKDVSKAPQQARKYAQESREAPDFFCVRKGLKSQIGYGFSASGHKLALPSLAAHIAQNKGSSFLALFEVEGGYYLLGVKDDAILSDAERFFENRSQALAELYNQISMFEWPEVIAPAGFDVDGARVASIDSVLTGRISVRLRDIRRRGSWTKYVVLALLAGVAIFGVRVWWAQQEEDRIAEAAIQKMNDLQVQVGIKEAEEKPPEMPWTNRVQGARAIETCVGEIMKVPLDIPGWDVKDIICQPPSAPTAAGPFVTVAANLSRARTLEDGGAPIQWAERMIRDNGLDPKLVMPDTGSSQNISMQWEIDGMPTIPLDLKTERLGKIRDSVLRVMESRMTSVTFSSPANQTAWFQGVNIEFSTKLSPLSYVDLLGAIPGFMLEQMTYNIDNKNYTIKGNAYERLPGPPKKNQ